MIVGNYISVCRMILIFAFIFVLGGCQHTIEIKEKSDGAESFVPLAEEPVDGVPLAYVKTIKVISNGIEGEPADHVFYRIRTKLLETKLFYDVVFQRPLANFVEVNLNITENVENNEGENFAKGMAAALTLFLLAPVFPQDFEYHSEYSLSLTNLVGEKRLYIASSRGSLEDPMGRKHLGEMQQKIIYNNLNSLMSQLLEDVDFILKQSSVSLPNVES